MQTLGIDIGGSGIKGAPVDTEKGVLLAERFRIPTPQPSVPNAVADVVAEIAQHFSWNGLVGCTFPAVVKNGIAHSAANVDKSWIGAHGQRLIEDRIGLTTTLLNDADAAGLAEMRFGAGKEHDGVVMILTLGTGIGSALFLNGQLLPNTELGHLELRGKDAEERASDRVRKEHDWSWGKWARRVDEYLQHVERLFSPDLIIIGGGVSKKADRFLHLLNIQAKLLPAQLLNDAGIVGAAVAAQPPT